MREDVFGWTRHFPDYLVYDAVPKQVSSFWEGVFLGEWFPWGKDGERSLVESLMDVVFQFVELNFPGCTGCLC